MIPLFKVYMSPEAGDMVKDVLYSGYVGQGQQVELFEQELKLKLNTPFLATVNSATSGLQLACKACGIRDRSVLTTPLTCVATNTSILAEGGRIQWVDINPNTLNMDVEDLERKLLGRSGMSRNYAAIMVVHWGGMSADMDAIKAVAKKRNVPIIEDCAHAWGAQYKGQSVGCTGNLSVFSFQAVKHMTSVDGGVVVCPTDVLESRIKKLRWYGIDRDDQDCDILELGNKFHMNDLNASIGRANLKYDTVHKRREVARWYKLLKDVPGVTLLEDDPSYRSSYFLYTIKVEKKDDFIKMMKSKGVEVGLPHKRNDKYKIFDYFNSELLPNLDSVYDSLVCIPCGWWLTHEEQQHIVDSIIEGW